MNEISWFKSWMPLADCPTPPVAMEGGIYRVGSQQYVFTVPYNRQFIADGSEPYITILAIAGSIGAAKRSLNMQVDADDGASIDWAALPNIEFSGTTYSKLRTMLGTFEHASYQVPTGTFVELKLQCKRMTFCFREKEVTEDSEPYVVQITT